MSLEFARTVLKREADAIGRLADNLDESFETAVKWLLDCQGRVITCGVG